MAGVKTPRMVEIVPMLPGPEPWERRDTEDEECFAAFVAYREMAPDERRIAGASTKRHTTVEKWYREHEWAARVRAYDAVFDKQRTAERLEVHRRKSAEVAADHMMVLADARELFAKEIAKLLEASRGSPMHGLIKVNDLIKLGSMVITMDRLLRNQTTENIGTTDVDYLKLSPDELDTMNELLERAGKKTEGEGGAPPAH